MPVSTNDDGKAIIDNGDRRGVLSMYAKGMTQIEISAQLGISQSTVSKELNRLRRLEDSKDFITRFSDLQLEYARHTAGTDAILKKMWEFVDDEKIHIKYRIVALFKLIELYEGKRDEMRFGLQVAIVAKDEEKQQKSVGAKQSLAGQR
jgi:transcriptional regulator